MRTLNQMFSWSLVLPRVVCSFLLVTGAHTYKEVVAIAFPSILLSAPSGVAAGSLCKITLPTWLHIGLVTD